MKRALIYVLICSLAVIAQYYPPVGGTGSGDVIGPATNTADRIPQWDGANSKTLKDGVGIVTSVGTPGSDTAIPTEAAVRTALGSLLTKCSGTISYTNAAFLVAATSASAATSCVIPARAVILKSILYPTAQWAGTGITSIKPSLGRTEATEDYIPMPSWDATSLPSVTMFSEGTLSSSMASHTAQLTITANTNLGNGAATVLTGGTIDYAIYYVTY